MTEHRANDEPVMEEAAQEGEVHFRTVDDILEYYRERHQGNRKENH